MQSGTLLHRARLFQKSFASVEVAGLGVASLLCVCELWGSYALPCAACLHKLCDTAAERTPPAYEVGPLKVSDGAPSGRGADGATTSIT